MYVYVYVCIYRLFDTFAATYTYINFHDSKPTFTQTFPITLSRMLLIMLFMCGIMLIIILPYHTWPIPFYWPS